MEGEEGKKARTARWPTVARQQQLTPQLPVFLSKICRKTSPLSRLKDGGLRGGGRGQTNLGLNQTFGHVSADPVAILLVPLLPPGVGGGGEPSFQTRPLQIYWCGKAGPHPLLLLVFALKKTSEFLTKLWRSQVCQQVVFFLIPQVIFSSLI